MDERTKLCSAAQDLATKVSSIEYGTLVSNLELLKGHFQDFPITLTMSVTARLYSCHLQRLLSKDSNMDVQIDILAATFAFWPGGDGECGEPMDSDVPSFYPIAAMLRGEKESQQDAESDENNDDELDVLMRQAKPDKAEDTEEVSDSQGEMKRKQQEEEEAFLKNVKAPSRYLLDGVS